MKKFTVTLLGLAVFAIPFAHAGEGLTLGASAGYVNIEDDDPGFSFDASDTGYKLFANYTFYNGLGIEGGYIDFGKPDDVVFGLPGEIDASGWNLYGVGNLPLSESVNVFAKAGFVAWEADSIIDGVVVGRDDDNDLALGLGASWNSDANFGLRTEFDWFDISGADNVWMASVGFELRF